MQKAMIISCSDNYSYNVRTKYIEKVLLNKGYEVKFITADFDHRTKKKYDPARENIILVHVPKYKKNMSFKRIFSHYIFAIKAKNIILKEKPALLYVSTPPNFLFKYMSKCKKIIDCKLIYDVGDLWPETLPLSPKIKLLIFPILKIWSNIRDKNLKNANEIIYECDFFKEKLKNNIINKFSKTFYLCKENELTNPIINEVSIKTINFIYIGSINNIIDIDLIIQFLVNVKKYKTIRLGIIGDGENLQEFLQLCKNNNIKTENYGIVYDEKIKGKILKDYHFGLNIMKESVAVGLTMKSLEYFHWGLGIINNIPADTYNIIYNNDCGYNIEKNNINNIAYNLSQLTVKDIINIKNNSRNVYEKFFSNIKFEKEIEKFIFKD